MALITYLLLLASFHITLGKDCLINNIPEQIAWEKQLRKDLKCNYRIFDPPITNSSAFTVSVRFVMKYFDFRSYQEVFTVQSWMLVSWTDDRLKWDPEKYYGITETEMTSTSLWTPSFRLFNSVDSNDFDRFYYVRCQLKNTGEVTCVPKVIHQAFCTVNLTNWPYDVQECSLEYGVWASKWANFTTKFGSRAITMFGAEYGSEWFISDYRQEEDHSAEMQLKMTFVLEREAAGLAAIVVYPSVILTALTITCLFLDVRNNVRLAVSCFSLASHYYFLSQLAYNIPKESAFTPILILYYRGSFVLSSLIVFFTFLLAAICKLKSIPQNYIISFNDFVYEGFGSYFVFPRWEVDDISVDNKRFSVDWTKFANIINSVVIFIIVIAYVSLYCFLMPKPAPVNY